MTVLAEHPKVVCSDRTISAYGQARSTITESPLSPDELRKIGAYWRASLYLCLGMLYLMENPLLCKNHAFEFGVDPPDITN